MQQVRKTIPIHNRQAVPDSLAAFDRFPQPQAWTPGDADWSAGRDVLTVRGLHESVMIESPTVFLEGGRTYYFFLSCSIVEAAGIRLTLLSKFREVAVRSIYGSGRKLCVISFNVLRSARFQLVLSSFHKDLPVRASLADLGLEVWVTKPVKATAAVTEMPHWSFTDKLVHAACKRWSSFNAVVAAIETHANKEELLSLPQYMALCPTGQCNASCGFCSVTTNRSGIIKKQIPFDKITSFFVPVAKTVRLFGIEGNGEPSLYDQFSDLVVALTSTGTPIYLITNGERLTEHQIALLLAAPTDSINFSLNACTPETHKSVMKLKSFDAVIDNIRRLVNWRGESYAPLISVSFVVTNHNIHEVRDFLLFAEWDLCVDRIFIRPLSEIANDEGTVEDARDLVPYESDIERMLDSVSEYMANVPRRADIHLDPHAFKAFRPDRASDGAFRIPHSGRWQIDTPGTEIKWTGSSIRLSTQTEPGPYLLRSYSIPCLTNARIEIPISIQVSEGRLGIGLLSQSGAAWIAHSSFESGSHQSSLRFDTADNEHVQICLYSQGPGNLDCTIDWGDIMEPAPAFSSRDIALDRLLLPVASSWRKDIPEADVNWLDDNRLGMNWNGRSGVYLLQSGPIPCLHMSNVDQHLPLKVEVRSGKLGIGIMDVRTQLFVDMEVFDVGSHDKSILIHTYNHDRLALVILSQSTDPLKAEIDFCGGLVLPKDWSSINQKDAARNLAEAMGQTRHLRDASLLAEQEAAKPPGVLRRMSNIYARFGWNGLLFKLASRFARHAIFPFMAFVIRHTMLTSFKVTMRTMFNMWIRTRYGSPKIYCQKPWTDLNNFTVDGRMDVCCITTGESQKRYALGNISDNSFQEIWNGERMKEFRRTVNAPDKLPPCERCPMANNYRSPF
ncbi:hypothetical protein BH11PSE11_BH11PSE11_02580 [soil metagenome]